MGLLLGGGATFSNTALASVECESSDTNATCTIYMNHGLSLETTVGTMENIGDQRYEIWGNVQVVAGSTRFPLNNTNIIVQLGDNVEFYGESKLRHLSAHGYLEHARCFLQIPRMLRPT